MGMKAQAFQNKDQIGMMSGRKTLEVTKRMLQRWIPLRCCSRLHSLSQAMKLLTHLLLSAECTDSCPRNWVLTLMHQLRRLRFRRKKRKRRKRTKMTKTTMLTRKTMLIRMKRKRQRKRMKNFEHAWKFWNGGPGADFEALAKSLADERGQNKVSDEEVWPSCGIARMTDQFWTSVSPWRFTLHCLPCTVRPLLRSFNKNTACASKS